MSVLTSRRARVALERKNASWPKTLKSIPRGDWPPTMLAMRCFPSAVWRSRDFLVVLYEERPGVRRLTVSSTHVSGADWRDGTTWDNSSM